jgi:hypothetical protein
MIVFEILEPGTTTFRLGPMSFSLSPDSLPSLPQPESVEEVFLGPHRATWIWNTEDLLQSSRELRALVEFLEEVGVDRVFLHLPGGPIRDARPEGVPIDPEALRPVVRSLTARGMQVYALDGYARYALPEFHSGVLNTIDNVAEYNADVRPNERFIGVRYDIEPYLLPKFHGPERAGLLTSLLQLTSASVARAHAAGLLYGADIPFWYDALSEESFEPVTVSFRGVEKPLSQHLIDLVDDVSIMDYRTMAHGADGTVRHGRGELEYAESLGKPVFIGLETSSLPDEVLLDFQGEPRRGLPHPTPEETVVVAASRGDSIFTALITNPGRPSDALQALTGWLEANQLRREDVGWWPISRRVEVPASKITFAGREPRLLESVMRATAHAFGHYKSFAGFAIHFAESYRAFLGRPPTVQPETPLSSQRSAGGH